MLNNIIEEYLDNSNREPREHKDRFYPTQSSCYINFPKYKRLYGKCLRAAYYSCIGIKEEPSKRLLKSIFGKYIEKALLDIFSSKGNIKKKKVQFKNEKYNISGELDAILTIEDKDYGLEIKSIGGENYYINSLIFSNSSPKWQDLFQTIIYCYCFKEELPNGFMLLYVRRDTGETKEFKIQIEPYKGNLIAFIDGRPDLRFTVQDILDRYTLLNKHINIEKTPAREYMQIYPMNLIPDYFKAGILTKKQVEKYNITPFGDNECRFCNYKTACKNDN